MYQISTKPPSLCAIKIFFKTKHVFGFIFFCYICFGRRQNSDTGGMARWPFLIVMMVTEMIVYGVYAYPRTNLKNNRIWKLFEPQP